MFAAHYADLSAYSKLRVYGDNGLVVRALFNRVADGSSDFVEKSGVITDGVFEVNLAEVGSYAHMNALKVNGGTGSAWRVMVVRFGPRKSLSTYVIAPYGQTFAH